MTSPLHIGSRRELLVDHYLIDRMDHAYLTLHHPQPQEVALTCDAPWETGGPGYPTVFYDEGLYRMYYRVSPAEGCEDHDERQLTCYAESDDGVRWRKPELGLFEVQGSARNNVVWRGLMSHNLTPFRDDNPDCPPEQQYKAVGGASTKWGGEGLCILVSPDGIRWHRSVDQPLALPGNFDSQNVVFWDRIDACYRAYWRDHRVADPIVPDGRDVRTAVSPDLIHWDEPQWLAYAPNRSGSPERDQTDDPTGDHHQFYCNGVLQYHRAPGFFLGFPQRYVDRGWTASTDALPDVGRRRALADKGIGGGRPTREGTVMTDVLFMVSRDGHRFFVWPEAFVWPGIQRPGSWYYGDAWYSWGLVETASRYPGAPAELSLYIQERENRDGPGHLRRHTLRLDGFASVYAPLSGGAMITKPLVFSGNRLEINFATSAGGRLRVEIQDEQGTPIPGFALDDCHLQYGDQLDRVVTWQGGTDVGALAGRPVRLRFELKDAHVFALQCRI